MQTLLRKTGAYQLLQKEVEKGGFSHAYLLLFDDSRHLRDGLKLFAKLFFDCANSTSPQKKRISALIDEESFSDCVCFPAEGKKLLVDDAERILEESSLSPVEGETKVFLLSNFDEANIQTQNKLLKLLEEPPKGCVFLLGARTAFPVLPTVLSRVKKLEISGFSVEDVTSFLTRKYGDLHDKKTLSLCAAAAGGNAGGAVDILEGGYYEALLNGAFHLIVAPTHRLPVTVKEMGETAYKTQLLTLLRLLFRDALTLKIGKTALLLPAQRAQSAQIAQLYSLESLLYAQEALSEAEKQVKFNAIFSQCIEICMAKIHSKNQKDK